MNPPLPPIFGSASSAKKKFSNPVFVGFVPASIRQQYSGLRVLANPQKNQRCELSFFPFQCLKQRRTLSLGNSEFSMKCSVGVYLMRIEREVLSGQETGTQLRMFLSLLLMCLRYQIFYLIRWYLQTIGFCSKSFCSSIIQPKKSTVFMNLPSWKVFMIPS